MQRKKYPKQQMCKNCKNYPCFDGIDNLETDFAQEGCRGFVFNAINNFR